MRLAWDAAFLATAIATNDSGVRQTLLPLPPMVTTNTAAAPIANMAHARNTLKRINTNPPNSCRQTPESSTRMALALRHAGRALVTCQQGGASSSYVEGRGHRA